MRTAYNIKMSKYDERCAAEGIMFIPLAVDSFGGWHGVALDVFSKLGRQLSRQLGKEEEEVTRQLRQRLSIILTRDNVALMGSRIPALPPATIDRNFCNPILLLAYVRLLFNFNKHTLALYYRIIGHLYYSSYQ